MAELARHLMAGVISNDQFEQRLPVSDDPAIGQMFRLGFWPLYSDHREHRLTGDHALGASDRREAARYILFLNTGAEYRWPIYPTITFWQVLADFFLLGSASRRIRRRFEQSCASIGDTDVWPFITRADYEAALRHPPYLHA